MGAYINGIGCVSPQGVHLPGQGAPLDHRSRMVQCPEPAVDTGLEDKYLRRMSRMIRLGWIAAKRCLEDGGGVVPDAIITGSGWGSVQDSEKFLLSIYRSQENFLPPTPFIQSTHNALGAQISMLLNSYDYNMSYAHSSFAFEHALLDSLLRLDERESQGILCGGFDEITPNQFILWDRLGWWRKEPAGNLELIGNPGRGTIAGEGFNFFFLQKVKNEKTYAEVKWAGTFITDDVAADSQMKKLIKDQKVDWVFAGLNGDLETDRIYRENIASLFPNGINIGVYKHLCGEYLTASSFAVAAAAAALANQKIPPVMRYMRHDEPSEIRNILVYHHHKGKNHSFILLSKAN